jgi:hypothetical protein
MTMTVRKLSTLAILASIQATLGVAPKRTHGDLRLMYGSDRPLDALSDTSAHDGRPWYGRSRTRAQVRAKAHAMLGPGASPADFRQLCRTLAR